MENTFDILELEKNAEAASTYLRMLANPSRLLVLCNLIEGEQSSGELARKIGISHPNLSQHMSKLKSQGLVDTRREETTIYYRIKDVRAAQIINVLHDLFCAAPGKN
ncbi:MAG: ArsR family transcriptional regulator [Alphaproteobacteria bacterium]|nr:MAG: ArsR family transcriptional regulator [Alphaproteobacteria bacterium]